MYLTTTSKQEPLVALLFTAGRTIVFLLHQSPQQHINIQRLTWKTRSDLVLRPNRLSDWQITRSDRSSD